MDRIRSRLATLACAFLFGLAAVPQAHAATLDAETLSSITRGGRLYDNWLRELEERAPVDRHPASPADAAFAAKPEDSWRCVSCHGWDYQGVAGMAGITGMAGSDPDAVLGVLTDDTHRFDEMLRQDDLADLAAFVAYGQSPLMRTVKPVAAPVAVNAFGEPIYQTICANCHGVDGQKMDTIAALGELARSNPWKALHNILNGHAGGAMPSFRSFDDQLALTMLDTLQSLPPRERLASITRGGRLYDNWPRETGREPPGDAHPAYPGRISSDSRVDAEDTWRCRECHGWDYRGKDGVYAEGRHATGIVGITAFAGKPEADVAAVLTDDTHRFGDLLTQRDIADLSNFVSAGQFPMETVIDAATGRIQPTQRDDYKAHYAMLCTTCHGVEGHTVRTMPPLGRVVNENPWRSLHSVLNGHPAEAMPPLHAFPRDLALGILSYVQTLPRHR